MQTLLLLAVLSGKLDDPASRPLAVVSHKLEDPEGWPPRVVPVAMRTEPEPKVAPEPPSPTPKPSAPADDWQVFAANPSYEVYGHIENGVFRYTQSRARVTTFRAAPRYYAPVLQYGSPCANGSRPR